MIHKPKDQTDDDADYERGSERQVERPMFATIADVAWQAAKAEWQFWTEIEQGTYDDEKRANGQKEAAELLRGFHHIWGEARP